MTYFHPTVIVYDVFPEINQLNQKLCSLIRLQYDDELIFQINVLDMPN